MLLSNKLKNLPPSESISPNYLQRVTKPPPNFLPNKLNRLSFLILAVRQVFQLMGCSWSSCLNGFQFFGVIFGNADTEVDTIWICYGLEMPSLSSSCYVIFPCWYNQKSHSSDRADYTKNPRLVLLSVTSPPFSSEPLLPMTASCDLHFLFWDIWSCIWLY